MIIIRKSILLRIVHFSLVSCAVETMVFLCNISIEISQTKIDLSKQKERMLEGACTKNFFSSDNSSIYQTYSMVISTIILLAKKVLSSELCTRKYSYKTLLVSILYVLISHMFYVLPFAPSLIKLTIRNSQNHGILHSLRFARSEQSDVCDPVDGAGTEFILQSVLYTRKKLIFSARAFYWCY